ncbi:hypothetical protein DPMN_025719 [Dreissena polymorpha]|uniref:Uncharacterized protein n=1 Tax=Dreissena polymorpha TaxID=45954 RepID=A0A9D4LRK6_DREPO|nr:hypothetical protein DPMN_025719 [Dreissena polymorpha]
MLLVTKTHHQFGEEPSVDPTQAGEISQVCSCIIAWHAACMHEAALEGIEVLF